MAIQNNVFIDIDSIEVLEEVHKKLESMFVGKKVKVDVNLYDDVQLAYYVDRVDKFILTTGPEEEDHRIYMNHMEEDCDFVVFIDNDPSNQDAISQIIFGDTSCTLISCGDKTQLSLV